MLRAIETENVIKNIIREIMREYSKKGADDITDACAACLIRLMVLNPEHGFINDRPLRRDDIQVLVNLCVLKLCEKNSSSLEAIKMQVYYETHHESRGDLIEERHNEIKVRTSPLRKEILEANARSREDLEKLYRKIVVVSIMSSGLGNPTYVPVMKEAAAAMQSVFPPSELGQFMALSRKEKEQQIQELTQIVTGIRLFNRDCQKGGEGIEDLPKLLQHALAATTDTMQMYLQKLMDNINTMTTALDNAIKRKLGHVKEDEEDEDEEDEEQNKEEEEEDQEERREEYDNNDERKEKDDIMKVTKADLDFIKGCLAVARQQEVFIRKLVAEVDVCNNEVKDYLVHLQRRLLQVHDTVRFRTAIPTVQVYPQFIDLSEVWTGLQDEMVILSNINTMATNLQRFVEVLDNMDMNVLKFLIGESPILTDADRLEFTTGLTINPEGMLCEVVDPTTVSDFDHIPLQYLGFCAWALVEGDGALIPGNPNMGLCRWKGKYYVFSTLEAAESFGQDPDKYILEALNMVRTRPELIGLLQLQDQIEAQKNVGEVVEKPPEPVVKRDSEMQTELHPIPSYIDPSYSWNEWDLKKRAVQLANLSKCSTHSTQTYKSHKRMSLGVQTNPVKDATCQTKRDNSTNVPKMQDYIFGLRGRKDNKQHVISLTPPIE